MLNKEKADVMGAAMKLMRTMRRRPHRPGCPPDGVGRVLAELAKAGSLRSHELSERLDVRPSSLTELLGRLERDGLIVRTTDENDKRAMSITPTEKGLALGNLIIAERAERSAKLSECFSDEEAEQFCAYCERFSQHLEKLSEEERNSHAHGCGHHHAMHGGMMPPPPFGRHHGHCPPPWGGDRGFMPPEVDCCESPNSPKADAYDGQFPVFDEDHIDGNVQPAGEQPGEGSGAD